MKRAHRLAHRLTWLLLVPLLSVLLWLSLTATPKRPGSAPLPAALPMEPG